jgi:hypothetical protein
MTKRLVQNASETKKLTQWLTLWEKTWTKFLSSLCVGVNVVNVTDRNQ